MAAPVERIVSSMGDIADEMLERYFGLLEDCPPRPGDYLHMSDDELREATSCARSEKVKSIRKWHGKLSDKQRYCLAAWIARR
jgi:hypothetical protein